MKAWIDPLWSSYCFIFKKIWFWYITYQNFLLLTYFLHWVLMWRCWIPLTIKMIRRKDIRIFLQGSPWRRYLAERTIDDSFIAKCHCAFIIGTSYGPFRFLMAHLQYFYVISNSFLWHFYVVMAECPRIFIIGKY